MSYCDRKQNNATIWSGIAFCTSFSVLYTAILVPVQLSFWSSRNVCSPYPLLKFDIFIDCWFMFEFLLRGFIGEYIDGKYVDEFWHLLAHRSSDSFHSIIDAISAFPFSVVSYSILVVRIDMFGTLVHIHSFNSWFPLTSYSAQSTCSGDSTCTSRFVEHCDSSSTAGFQYDWWSFVLILKLVRILKVFFLNTDVMMRYVSFVSDFFVLRLIFYFSVSF